MSTSYDEPARTTGDTESLMIVELPYTHPDARYLVQALFDEQVDRYGYADPAEASPELYRPPQGLFLVGYHGGRAVSCGGFRSHNVNTAEIKKMYTLPDERGRGHGLAIIRELERRAAAAGAQRALLETGICRLELRAIAFTVG